MNICPKCNSAKTKKVSVVDDKWKIGAHRCLNCGYQGDWMEFKYKPEEEGSVVLYNRKEHEPEPKQIS